MTRWLVPEELGHYEPVSRSLRIEGYSTSVRLERVFWDVLDHIAAARHISTCSLVGEIYRDVHQSGEPLGNFSSVLRVICLRHLDLAAEDAPLAFAAVRPGEPPRDPNARHPDEHRSADDGVHPAHCPSCGLRAAR